MTFLAYSPFHGKNLAVEIAQNLNLRAGDNLIISKEGMLYVATFDSFVPLSKADAKFERIATKEDLGKIATNEKIAKLVKAEVSKKSEAIFSAIFDFRKKNLKLYLRSKDPNLRSLIPILEKRFSAHIEIAFTSSRTLCALSDCGFTQCCIYQEATPTTFSWAKKKGINLKDSANCGICGRLKCCLKRD